MVFPVIGPASYSNDFYAPRSGGIHGAIDIFASKHRQLISPVKGTITSVIVPQASWGYSVTVRDADGYSYRLIHMNNDTPGTDNGNGGAMNAYGPDMKVGNPVASGQLVGYLGDSGNAENTSPHVHFEIFAPDGSLVNPYDSLNQADRLARPSSYPQLPNELLPYGFFPGTVSIAMGNLEGDSASEFITGAGPGAGPHVIAFRANNTVLASFYAYDPGFRGGIDVAAGDVDGDGIDEIITGSGPGAGSHVIAYRLNGSVVASFSPYGNFGGGTKVAAGDVDGDGIDEIITGAGPGAGPHVIAFRTNGTVLASFYAYGAEFHGGVDVASADIEGTAAAEIITGAGPGAGPHVIAFKADGTVLSSFFAYGPDFRGGVRVSAGNARANTAKSEILTVYASPPGGPHVRMFNYAGTIIRETNFMEFWWEGYHDISAGNGTSRGATGGNRRGSVRIGPN